MCFPQRGVEKARIEGYAKAREPPL